MVEASIKCAVRVLDCKDLLQALNSEEGFIGKAQLAGICPAMSGHLCLDTARNRGKLDSQYARSLSGAACLPEGKAAGQAALDLSESLLQCLARV